MESVLQMLYQLSYIKCCEMIEEEEKCSVTARRASTKFRNNKAIVVCSTSLQPTRKFAVNAFRLSLLPSAIQAG